jgi:hypothetical protein
VIAQIVGHRFAGGETLSDLGVGDVAGDHHGTRQHDPGPHRVARQFRPDVGHRPRQIDVDNVVGQLRGVRLGQEPGRVGLELLEEHPLGRDLAERLTVRRARHRNRHRARRPVTGKPHDAHVMAEVLPAELGSDAERPGLVENRRLELRIADGVAESVTLGGETVEVTGGGQLRRLERHLRRRAADDDRKVVGRARRRAEQAELLIEKLGEPGRVQQGFGLLEQQ